MNYSWKNMSNTLKENNFNFKKNFGQNFIVDENTIDRILELSNIEKESLIIEIGPGAGSLTKKLVKKAQNVLCYEIDTTLKPILEENFKKNDNLEIIYEDFLKRDVKKDLEKYTYKHLFVIANLPYYITTPIITKFIEEKIEIDKMVIMVQKEVGNRFKAKVGTKEYNSLTIFLNYYFDVKKIMDVSRNVFLPKPNVDSIVIELKRKIKKDPLKNPDLFFKLVRDSFTQKRKTLRNNLKNYDLEKIEQVLKTSGFDLNVRAEQLSIEVFEKIANDL